MAIQVESKVIYVNGRRLKKVTLPPVMIAESEITNGGYGLFVSAKVRKGNFIAEFGGLIVDHKTATRLLEEGRDTHLRSLYPLVNCLDGRVTKELPITWYARNLVVASFANDPYGTEKKANVRVDVVDVKGHKNPAEEQYTMRRVFLRATGDLDEGSEIFLNYGKNYHRRHFKD